MRQLDSLQNWLEAHPTAASYMSALLLLLAAALVYYLTRRYLVRAISKAVASSSMKWDDALLQHKVLRRAALVASILIIYFGHRSIPLPDESLRAAIRTGTLAALLSAFLLLVSTLLTAINDIYTLYPVSRGRPIKGYLQIAKILMFVLGVVLVISILLDKSPLYFLTGVGAMTAVILLIFRDTILSFVASIQIASNDMIRIGDWIEMPQFAADGDVIDIALHTVKVQNWDKTITTIPTYKMIDESFRNWRGMQESGGRRLKRAVHIDMRSIAFLDEKQIDRFEHFVLLESYIQKKKAELEEYNRAQTSGTDLVANARRLTNVGTFRAYVRNYLREHPGIHGEGMTFLVRQLPPGAEGLPIEIYVFTKTTAWVDYEQTQADIFDHILGILPEFGLRVYQGPTGYDFEALRQVSDAARES